MSNTLQNAGSAAQSVQPMVRESGSPDREPTGFAAGDPSANEPTKLGALLSNPDVRQFIKFCLVGTSSTIVMFVIDWLCLYKFKLPLFSSLTAAFLLSCLNGFTWNRLWTFKAARANSAHEQSIKFFAVNLVGYLLNTSIVVLLIAHFTVHGGMIHDPDGLKRVLINVVTGEKGSYPKRLVFGSQGTAVAIVVFWNYFANRMWTFKH